MWVLIIALYASTLSKGDSVALTSVPGFDSELACIIAGDKATSFNTLMKNCKFVCVKTSLPRG